MAEAFAWIGQIFEWIGQFFPHLKIVPTTAAAIKFIRGSKVVPLGPGWHWYWPFTTMFVEYPVARQAVDLRAQTIVTRDDKTIVVGGLIVFEIVDIERCLAHTYDPEDTIKDISLSAIHDVVCQYTWEDLKEAQRNGKLNKKLREEVRRGLQPYGVRLIKATLTDLAICRVFKLMTQGDHYHHGKEVG